MKAQISNKISKLTTVLLIISMFVYITLIPMLVCLLIAFRKRKLTELSVSNSEVVDSYTAFIPIAKIALRMPINKIDNVSVVNSPLFIYTGKTVKICSASGVIRILYVENADEVVAYISEAIEEARKEQTKPVINNDQSDYAGSIKKLSELRDAGIITEDEFNQKKAELLDKI